MQNHFSFIAALGAVASLLLSGANTAVAQTIFKDSYEQAAVITSFTVSADEIMQGESTTISWTTIGATMCTPSGGAGDWAATEISLPDGNAQIQINESGDFTFTLTCIGIIGGQAFGNTTVSASPVPAEITSFVASPDAIAEGDSTTLSWTTNFATSCTPTNGAGDWAAKNIDLPSGDTQVDIPDSGDYTFTLTCSGDVGDPAVSEDSVTVSPAAVITSFSASSNSIAEGETTTLSWTTENASSCTASGGAGGWSGQNIGLPGGSTPITIASVGEYTFTLTCDGVAGTPAVANEVVTVSAAAVISSFTATPGSLVVDDMTTLSWVTENATSCTPSGGPGWLGCSDY